MKVSVLQIAHYGADYSGFALRSVYDHVHDIQVVYVPAPSHGHQTSLKCPDSRQEMMNACMVGPKVHWTDASFRYEGQHRDYAMSLCKGDLVLVVDCDEVWHEDVLERALRFAWDGGHRGTLVNFSTPWRSFNWVCRDNMWPVRVIKRSGEGTAYFPREGNPIWHFGYCVRSGIMAYKQECHGHKDEWRPNWFVEKWNPWPPVPDCHPTCERTWFPEPFNREFLPSLMKLHPFWDVEPVP